MAQPERQRVGRRSVGAEPGCRRPLTAILDRAASLFSAPNRPIWAAKYHQLPLALWGVSRFHAFCFVLCKHNFMLTTSNLAYKRYITILTVSQRAKLKINYREPTIETYGGL
jgi:hypothetical protein